MQKWAENIKNVIGQNLPSWRFAAVNNHYASFGHGPVNLYRNMVIVELSLG